MPVSNISTWVDCSSKGGAGRWIGYVFLALMAGPLSTGSPMMLMMRPSVCWPTGMLGNLEHQLLGVGEDVLVLDPLHFQRVVDGGELARRELDIDHRTDDLDDLSLAHASAPFHWLASNGGAPAPRRPAARTTFA